jgi:hypothetical protein
MAHHAIKKPSSATLVVADFRNEIGTKRTWRGGRRRSVVGGKADLTIVPADFRL